MARTSIVAISTMNGDCFAWPIGEIERGWSAIEAQRRCEGKAYVRCPKYRVAARGLARKQKASTSRS
jgi:hypothetical protein